MSHGKFLTSNTDHVKAMGFIRIKSFNDFCNIIFSKRIYLDLLSWAGELRCLLARLRLLHGQKPYEGSYLLHDSLKSLLYRLILTINPLSFWISGVIKTELSNFYKMAVTFMKATFQKLDHKTIHYKDYWKYCNYSFRQNLFLVHIGNGKYKFK